jgi:signal transduction histidine kinase
MAALGLIPVGAGIAILRHRLFDIDLLISRTVSYGALSAMVVAIYLITVVLIGALLRRPEDPLVSPGAALVAALVFNPLRVRVQRAVDGLVYGQRSDPYAVVAELGRRLGAALDPDSVLPTIARTVGDSLRLPYVAVELNAGDGERIVASHGTPRDPVTRLPLVYQQETVGNLLVSPRVGEATLGRKDMAVLEALSRQAGVVAHGVHVTADLRRARERLVVAREEERRRLLRDLHDELGPRLASHTLLVDAARSAMTRDGNRAEALLADLAQEIRRSLEEVRRIARGLRPPALDELGLSEALRDAADQCASNQLAVEVDIADIESTPTAVETAAYHVAREALANVVRHANARWCAVRLHRNGDGMLVLEVADNGRGVVPGTPSGLGFKSMRERPAEVGGHCSIEERLGGGTRVTAVFPLSRKP